MEELVITGQIVHYLCRIKEMVNKTSLESLKEHTSHGIVIGNRPRRVAQVKVMK